MSLRALTRSFSSSRMGSTAKVSPFTQAVVGAVRNLYPEKLADSSFDNTGLLLEAPHRPGHLKNSVLLTIDLTSGVADEAIARKDSLVISYHPIIFRGLKSITLGNSQQNSLLRLAQEGISVYSPHTAVDAAPGGLNDWLADVIIGNGSSSQAQHTRSIINPVKGIVDTETTGYGRIVRFQEPQTLGSLIKHINSGLGNLPGLSVATPQSVPGGKKSDIKISSVGICAGSGGSMLNGLDVDLLFTGELSHHEALAAVEQGRCVITAFHSNTERAFLRQRMQSALIKELEGLKSSDDTASLAEGFEVDVSKVDRDPYEIVVPGQTSF